MFNQIVIHRHDCFIVSQLFSRARDVKFLKLGSKSSWFVCQPKIIPHSYEETSISDGISNTNVWLFVYIYPLNSYWVINSFEKPCYTRVATITSFAREVNSTWLGSIYKSLYIYIWFESKEFVGDIFKQARAHFFAHKWFQVFLLFTQYSRYCLLSNYIYIYINNEKNKFANYCSIQLITNWKSEYKYPANG